MTLGQTLRSLRISEGVSIKTLAPRLGVDHTYLSKLENDRAKPSEDVIQRLARYFSYDADELLMLAGRVPEDVQQILRDNPRDAIKFLRERFVRGTSGPSSREPN